MSSALMPSGRLWAAYLREIRFEFLKAWRTPAFSIPTLFFPVMFYLLFGVLLAKVMGGGQVALDTFLRFGVFGAMGPGLFGFGVSLAIEREYGLMKFKQALPQPAGAYLLARAFMVMMFVGVIALMLTVLALTVGKVSLSVGTLLQLFAIDVLGALPFCAIGMYLGWVLSGQGAPAVINFVFLPMAFLSGIFIPLQVFPPFLQQMAPVFPSYHLAQLALHAADKPSIGSPAVHVAVLAGMTLFFFALAVRRMQGAGFRLLGARPGRTVAVATGVVAVLVALAFSELFGGRSAAPDADGDTTAGSADAAADAGAASATDNQPPLGVPAPGEGLVANFDAESATAAYGMGLQAIGDEFQGGKSTATQRLVPGGATGSRGALLIEGEVRAGTQFPSAGAAFFPEGPPTQGLMDYSARQTLSFYARGDGQSYTLLVLSGTPTRMPPLMLSFTAGPEWQKFEFKLADLGAADWQRVRMFGWLQMAPGPFRFQLDEIRVD